MNKEEARPGTNQNGHSLLELQLVYHVRCSRSSAARGPR
jgi:hypothetical protein